MQVRWSPAAADDLERLFNFIKADNRGAGQRVAQTIYDRAGALGAHPYQGRQGRVEGTRELSLPPLPFIVIYRVLERADAIEIVQCDPRRPTLAASHLAAPSVLFVGASITPYVRAEMKAEKLCTT